MYREAKAARFFALCDTDGSGAVDLEEFQVRRNTFIIFTLFITVYSFGLYYFVRLQCML